jgi:peptidoglycan/LPS O-acetylase OafA/YrhL
VFLLAGNAVIGYKPIMAGQIVSQFLGTGYFTHRDSLVGVHTWFISLILVCYGLAALVRGQRWLLPLFGIVVIALLPLDGFLLGPLLAFLAGGVIACVSWTGTALYVLTAATWVSSILVNEDFAYPLLAILALAAGSVPLGMSSPRLTRVSRATYEFFLVHGTIYLVLARYAGLPFLANLLLGTGLAVLATWFLCHFVEQIQARLGRLRLRGADAGSRTLLGGMQSEHSHG